MQTKNYRRLSFQERVIIQTYWQDGKSKTFIANRLGRHKSTITREINRWVSHPSDKYNAVLADWYTHDSFRKKRVKDKISTHSLLKYYVYKRLLLHWSPEQIAGRIKSDYPKSTLMRISHEAIYMHIYSHRQAKLNLKLIQLLPFHHSRRRKTYASRGVSQVKVTGKISIDQRPEYINNRTQIGHWEGDLIIGEKRKSALATLVERKTRFTYIIRVKDKKSETVTQAINKVFQKLPKRLRRSMTYDNGVEMANHLWLTNTTGATVYFAHSYSSWQRGTNENTNGLIRRYLPKGTDFNKISDQQILDIQHKLNTRPRKVIRYKKPIEIFPVQLSNINCHNYYSVNVRK